MSDGLSRPDSDRSPPRLAICVVYVCDAGQEWLLALHLRMIRANTRLPYCILAAVPRASRQAVQLLRDEPGVRIIETTATRRRSSHEHAHHLDQLVALAAARRFSHVATLDVDSFPVAQDWDTRLIAGMDARRPLAAVFRAENHDRNLPHPCGLICDLDFYRLHRPQFFPRKMSGPDWQRFKRAFGQKPDTGLGYAEAVFRQGMDWTRLMRSNRHEDHVLMAGIYGDCIFHLGAMSRPPVFRSDWYSTRWLRWVHTRRKHRYLARYAAWQTQRFRARNEISLTRIIEKLRRDPDGYIAWLRGL